MLRDEATIEAINELWTPVYPYLAEHLRSLGGSPLQTLLDLGPFAGGVALSLLRAEPECRATVLDESADVLRWVEERARLDGSADRLTTRQAPLCPLPSPDAAFDRVVVRGAFFFLTAALLREVWRVLRPGGVAWVGGGYGPSTPPPVIAPIADASRRLNAQLGKQWVAPEGALGVVEAAGLGDAARIATRGGLWIEVRR